MLRNIALTSPKNLLSVRPERSTSALPTVEIAVQQNTLDLMFKAIWTGDPYEGHAPGGDRPYFRARYRDETGDIRTCKIAYRGFGHWHHWSIKPSLRIKIRKRNVRGQRRFVELQRPEDVLAMRNWLPERLGADLGLMDSGSDHVRLFINKKYRGVYVRGFRPGAPLTIHNGRMPGTYFKGDVLHRKPGQGNLWDSSAAWAIEGEGAHADIAVLEDALEVMRRPATLESLITARQLLDMERFARWSALLALTGSLHADMFHNHLLFITSNQGRLEPVPWDLNGYGTHATPQTPVDTVRNPFANILLRDPHWVHLRNETIHAALLGPASQEQLFGRIDEQLQRLMPDLRADVNLGTLQNAAPFGVLGTRMVAASPSEIIPSHQALMEWISARGRFLRAYLDDARVTIRPMQPGTNWIRVKVDGRVAVRARARSRTTLRAKDPTGRYTMKGSTILLYPATTEDTRPFLSMPYGAPIEVDIVDPAPMIYDLEASLDELVFENAVTGAPVQPAAWRASPPTRTRTIHPWAFPPERVGDVVLGPGIVDLREDLVVGATERLIIRPGTRVRLAAGVGIYSRGRTLVQGTATEPVLLEPAGPLPWGAFGISGAATTGSRITHMHAHGGSTGTNGAVRFKGMFNVYDCPNVLLRGCRFGKNFVGDDAVNLAESAILVEDCHFANARSDALDLDRCKGRIRNSRFARAGNDGLDLMTSEITIDSCTFTGCGDKALSIGEDSRVVMRESRVENCAIGIEVKDNSRVAVVGSILHNNSRNWNAYQKKWEYAGGGHGLLVDCTLDSSQGADVTLAARSSLTLLRTPMPQSVDGEHAVRVVHALSPEWRAMLEATAP